MIFKISSFENNVSILKTPNRKAKELENNWKRWDVVKTSNPSESDQPRLPEVEREDDNDVDKAEMPETSSTSKDGGKKKDKKRKSMTDEEADDLKSPEKKL